MLQEQSVNAILTDPENRTLWINGNPYGNAYIDRADNNYDNLSTSNNYEEIGTIHGEIFNDFDNNEAKGDYSHAEGLNTRTKNLGEHAEGKYNYSVEAGEVEIEELDTDTKLSRGTISTIGIGTNDENRKNAFRVDNTGEVYIVGVDSTLPDGRKVSYDPCTYDGTKKTVETRSLQEVIQGLGTMQEVTYGELRTLIDNKRLVPGMQYRITDYHGEIDYDYKYAYYFANNKYDIIVVADSEDTLNENARACHHDFTNEKQSIIDNKIFQNIELNDILELTEENMISIENYEKYNKMSYIDKQTLNPKVKEVYDNINEEILKIDNQELYFKSSNINTWKLKYDVLTNNVKWLSDEYINDIIRLNVQVGNKRQLREYIFSNEIDYNNYKYKWKLYRYQNVNNEKIYDFDTTLTNDDKIIYVDQNINHNTKYSDNISDVLLTSLRYPLNENRGELLFCKDEKLYNIQLEYKDINLFNLSYIFTKQTVENEYTNKYVESTVTSLEHYKGKYLYFGEEIINNEKYYKWYQVVNLYNPNNIDSDDNNDNNSDFIVKNYEKKIFSKSNNPYYLKVLCKSSTNIYKTINNTYTSKGTSQTQYINNVLDLDNCLFIKEYLNLENINKDDYKVQVCGQVENIDIPSDYIEIFYKPNNYNDYVVHFQLDESTYYSLYDEADNKIYYYAVWKNKNKLENININWYILTGKCQSITELHNYINSISLDTLNGELQNNNIFKVTTDLDIIANDVLFIIDDIPYKNYNCINPSNFTDGSITQLDPFELYKIFNFTDEQENELKSSLSATIIINDYIKYLAYYNNYNIININSTLSNCYKYVDINNTNTNYNFIFLDNLDYCLLYFNYEEAEDIVYTETDIFKYIDKQYKSTGFVYYLEDEFYNKCNYDFKNLQYILFLGDKSNDVSGNFDYCFYDYDSSSYSYDNECLPDSNWNETTSTKDETYKKMIDSIYTTLNSKKEGTGNVVASFYTYSDVNYVEDSEGNVTAIVYPISDLSLNGVNTDYNAKNNSIFYNNIYNELPNVWFMNSNVLNNIITNSKNINLLYTIFEDNIMNSCNVSTYNNDGKYYQSIQRYYYLFSLVPNTLVPPLSLMVPLSYISYSSDSLLYALNNHDKFHTIINNIFNNCSSLYLGNSNDSDEIKLSILNNKFINCINYSTDRIYSIGIYDKDKYIIKDSIIYYNDTYGVSSLDSKTDICLPNIQGKNNDLYLTYNNITTNKVDKSIDGGSEDYYVTNFTNSTNSNVRKETTANGKTTYTEYKNKGTNLISINNENYESVDGKSIRIESNITETIIEEGSEKPNKFLTYFDLNKQRSRFKSTKNIDDFLGNETQATITPEVKYPNVQSYEDKSVLLSNSKSISDPRVYLENSIDTTADIDGKLNEREIGQKQEGDIFNDYCGFITWRSSYDGRCDISDPKSVKYELRLRDILDGINSNISKKYEIGSGYSKQVGDFDIALNDKYYNKNTRYEIDEVTYYKLINPTDKKQTDDELLFNDKLLFNNIDLDISLPCIYWYYAVSQYLNGKKITLKNLDIYWFMNVTYPTFNSSSDIVAYSLCQYNSGTQIQSITDPRYGGWNFIMFGYTPSHNSQDFNNFKNDFINKIKTFLYDHVFVKSNGNKNELVFGEINGESLTILDKANPIVTIDLKPMFSMYLNWTVGEGNSINYMIGSNLYIKTNNNFNNINQNTLSQYQYKYNDSHTWSKNYPEENILIFLKNQNVVTLNNTSTFENACKSLGSSSDVSIDIKLSGIDYKITSNQITANNYVVDIYDKAVIIKSEDDNIYAGIGFIYDSEDTQYPQKPYLFYKYKDGSVTKISLDSIQTK